MFVRLSLALDSLGGFRTATHSTVAESQQAPELLGSLACLLRQPREFPPLLPLLRLMLPRLLTDTGQFELLTPLQLQPSCPNFAGFGSRDYLMREPVSEVLDQPPDQLLGVF
ncbi:hypothetical protein ACWDSF_04090 [Nocardia beijingensis]